MQRSDESHRSLKTAFSAVLKTLRLQKGLTQQHLAEASSRTYLSKLERGQSSLTLDKLNALSSVLGLSPLTLVAVTLGAQRGQTVKTLLVELEREISDLAEAGVLKQLQIPDRTEQTTQTATLLLKARALKNDSSQIAFHFAD